MAHRAGRPGPNRRARNHRNRPLAPDAEDSHALPSSDSDSSSESDGESARLSGLAASFRIVSESLLRMEQTELEMTKAREAMRLEAEKRRLESEAELTQMLLQTQLQIASLVSRRRRDHPSRKRKRAEEEGEEGGENDSSSSPNSEGALALSLLQCNLLL
ncbi:hypothetical protein RchiOBHm_Chr5g0002091 [Rosa chinensis]|uniref:Uncharacterized protein n=1 Tax=Rosa chinensis TaxID=74649 RepID=A0A2P6Q2E7_ROSCH|nr:uncharacterized protein At4g22160 [Rosa chinensis]PRQ28347.1 hypothetical protein RchiOBHm_Chr5g0002091 [Rosa chinensis]